MALTNGAQKVETIPGKRVVKSGATGSTTVEEVKWLTETLLSLTSSWQSSGWAYIVDITKMDPVTPDISAELVNLHKAFGQANCKAMAFVDYCSFVTAVQANQHQKQADNEILQAHFKTDEEALAWIDTILD